MHWSVQEKNMQEKHPEAFAVWSLENAVNFGMRAKKINKTQLLKYWNQLKLDASKRKFLNMLLKK